LAVVGEHQAVRLGIAWESLECGIVVQCVCVGAEQRRAEQSRVER
jgi:hypothetical protein